MVIGFKGNCPSQRFFRVGVEGNNNTDTLILVFDRLQGSINLEEYHAYIKLCNSDMTYCDKTSDFAVDTSEPQKIKLSYDVPDKVTRQKSVDMQVVFEKDNFVWQSVIFNITFDRFINADEIITQEYPSILREYGDKIASLENTKSSITQCLTRRHFPEQGAANVMYVDMSSNDTYIFDEIADKYILIGFDYNTIKTINGNGD